MGKWLIFTAFVAIGCSTIQQIRTNDLAGESRMRSKIAREASLYIGSKYRYGGSDRSGFDCSGLVFQVYKSNGIMLPRSSRQQASHGKKISLDHINVGDLIFFKQKGKINHVAIVSKTNRHDIWVIHSTTSRGVIQERLFASQYWSARIYCTRDVLANLP